MHISVFFKPSSTVSIAIFYSFKAFVLKQTPTLRNRKHEICFVLIQNMEAVTFHLIGLIESERGKCKSMR